jgi:glycosyltransferase involved in cell wall biosynthesis
VAAIRSSAISYQIRRHSGLNSRNVVSNNSSRRAIIIVPGLKNRIGHEYGYTLAVANAFRSQGLDVSILGATTATSVVTELEGFEPVFHHPEDNDDKRPSRWIILKRGWFFARDLAKAIKSLELRQDDLIFDHTILYPNFAGWLWVWLRYRRHIPQVTLMFRYSLNGRVPSRFPTLRRLLFPFFYRTMFFVFQRSSNPPRIVVDTEDLKCEYRSYTKLPINVVPIPLDLPEYETSDTVHRNNDNDLSIRLLYLGGARLGKGFDLLPALADHLLSNADLNVSLFIHTGESSTSYDEPGIDEVFMRLREQHDGRRVVLIETHLDDAKYLELLTECDAVVLPYRTEYYVGQSSNVLVEAISNGKPVVVSRGTWLSSSAERGSFGTTFQSGNSEGLVTASMAMVSGISEFTAKARSNSRQWREFHTADNLVNFLTQTHDGS